MKKLITIVSIVLLITIIPWKTEAQSSSATLSAGNGSGMPGNTGISIPIRISADAQAGVTGINFDLNFDSNRLTPQNVTVGSAASSAGKSLSWSSPSSGKVRVIIFGFNQTPMTSGVIANIVVSINSSAAPGSFSLSLSNAVATDSSGSSVSLSLNSGSFTVNAPPPPPATATHTSVPPTPTVTATSQPKTMPSSTPTATMTPTVQPINTTIPTSTNALPATATRTPTPTSTVSSGFSTQIPPTKTTNPSETETVAAVTSPMPTPSANSDADLSTLDFPSALETGSPDGSIDSLEAAVAATGTALAQAQNSSKDKSVAAVVGSDPDDPKGGTTVKLLAALTQNISMISTLFLVAGVASALMIPPVAIYIIRHRSTLLKHSRNSQSAVAQIGSPDPSMHLRNR